jgi:hypothetical protein
MRISVGWLGAATRAYGEKICGELVQEAQLLAGDAPRREARNPLGQPPRRFEGACRMLSLQRAQSRVGGFAALH